MASPQELKAFNDLVASQSLPSQKIGDVKKSDLPGLKSLSILTHFPLSHAHLVTSPSSRSQAGRGQNDTNLINNRGTPIVGWHRSYA
ncbi:hypothetical protein BC827DRAFT_102490 [Russula dissimulans]|nr:hypothetical protein BC827DRAFT_102490 [Russula dissimulans]